MFENPSALHEGELQRIATSDGGMAVWSGEESNPSAQLPAGGEEGTEEGVIPPGTNPTDPDEED